MAKKRGLGKNLDALLGGATTQHQKSARAVDDEVSESVDEQKKTDRASSAKSQRAETTTIKTQKSESKSSDVTDEMPQSASHSNNEVLKEIPIERIRRGTYQPRRQFDQDALQELADSITAQGLIQPILVRPFADGYEIIAGERRWRAAQLAGLQQISALVRDLDDPSVAAVSLIENIQRKDLNPLEEASALQRLQSEFGMTHQEVATAVGRSRTAVTNLMRLLDLHDEVKVLVDKGELDMGHARALLAIEPERQFGLAKTIVAKGLSVRAAEKLVKAEKEPADQSKSVKRDPDIVALEKSLGRTLAASVSIKHLSSGKGKLEISYNSIDELEGILTHIK